MKLLRSIAVLFTLICFNCESSKTYEEQIKKYKFYIKKTDSLIANEKYEDVFIYVNSAIEITDTIPIAFYKKGRAAYNLNWLDIAEENFTKVIEIEGEQSKTYKDRAKVYLKKKDNDFLDDINIYLKYYSNDDEAHVLKREYFEEREDFSKAIEEYNYEIEKHKDSIELYMKRSNLFYLNKEYDKALEDYNKVLELSPDNTAIQGKKKSLLKELNDHDNLLRCITIIIAIYVFYILLSFFVFKPFVIKKATNQIGGDFIIKKDPLIWLLPILLSLFVISLYFTGFIPNFK
ncbi:tetratricopeptide repeat protein [Lacinutrix sp. 5H-3-7-4]|uniref:tetratricopeptide repeat protein n=1 Tax=Lacinutrix sp. (strain 5H-3-7-4) TaxID=983544 RepID=UPI00020A3D65|nr:tetratricopeptide repeat protein [Lacinutrix sp. 5H-3-7-4]AEG99876.1 Tetratricopeptide TPR_2 repeat-containing protein [Lacinutrix sp. 5H-3-7-4]